MIIKPQGPPVKRIVIEVDAKGVVQLKGVNLIAKLEMHPMETALNLLQIATSSLIAMMSPQVAEKEKQNAASEEDHNGIH